MSRATLSLLLLPLMAGCGGDAAGGAAAQMVVTAPWQAPTQSWQVVPEALTAVAEHDGRVLIGQQGRLSELGLGGASLIAELPVLALATLIGVGIVVLDGDGGLHVWDGELHPSPLDEALDGPAAAITVRRDELWIATAASLYRWDGGDLTHVAHAAGRVQGVRSSDRLAAGQALITPEESGFEVIDLGVPTFVTQDAVLGLFEGGLWGWQDKNWAHTGLDQVSAVLVDPLGVAYARTRAGVVRLDSQGAWSLRAGQDWAASLNGLWSGAGDGLLTLVGTELMLPEPVTDGGEGEGEADEPAPDPEISYTADVAPFSEASCERCHKPLGIARDLTTYAAWVANVDLAIMAIDDGRMPQDGGGLIGGDAQLLRRWRNGGFIE